MFKYEFVTVKGQFTRSKTKEAYERKVRDYAINGWRLVSVIPPNLFSFDYELVFEKDATERNVLK